jgi:hypothetical protein
MNILFWLSTGVKTPGQICPPGATYGQPVPAIDHTLGMGEQVWANPV